MKYVVYRRPNGSIVKYPLKPVQQGSFTRYGIFEGDTEIVPEDRQENFVKYTEA